MIGYMPCCSELPPRARRIHCIGVAPGGVMGTTSACAENTVSIAVMVGHMWNYLRVRGEYTRTHVVSATSQELPPRARRILINTHAFLQAYGTTSACAENTDQHARLPSGLRNYLRVRGEY